MANQLWKHVERTIASMLNGRRVPVSGRQRGDAPDIEHETLSVEIKSFKKVPGYSFYLDALDQATKSVSSDKAGDIPIMIAHQKGCHHKKDLVVMFLGDFIEGFLDEDKQATKLKTVWRHLDSEEDGLREAEAEDILSGYK